MQEGPSSLYAARAAAAGAPVYVSTNGVPSCAPQAGREQQVVMSSAPYITPYQQLPMPAQFMHPGAAAFNPAYAMAAQGGFPFPQRGVDVAAASQAYFPGAFQGNMGAPAWISNPNLAYAASAPGSTAAAVPRAISQGQTHPGAEQAYAQQPSLMVSPQDPMAFRAGLPFNPGAVSEARRELVHPRLAAEQQPRAQALPPQAPPLLGMSSYLPYMPSQAYPQAGMPVPAADPSAWPMGYAGFGGGYMPAGPMTPDAMQALWIQQQMRLGAGAMAPAAPGNPGAVNPFFTAGPQAMFAVSAAARSGADASTADPTLANPGAMPQLPPQYYQPLVAAAAMRDPLYGPGGSAVLPVGAGFQRLDSGAQSFRPVDSVDAATGWEGAAGQTESVRNLSLLSRAALGGADTHSGHISMADAAAARGSQPRHPQGAAHARPNPAVSYFGPASYPAGGAFDLSSRPDTKGPARPSSTQQRRSRDGDDEDDDPNFRPGRREEGIVIKKRRTGSALSLKDREVAASIQCRRQRPTPLMDIYERISVARTRLAELKCKRNGLATAVQEAKAECDRLRALASVHHQTSTVTEPESAVESQIGPQPAPSISTGSSGNLSLESSLGDVAKPRMSSPVSPVQEEGPALPDQVLDSIEKARSERSRSNTPHADATSTEGSDVDASHESQASEDD